MTEPHDASNCDAFPLAVALAQAKTRLAAAEADADRLAALLESIWDGGELGNFDSQRIAEVLAAHKA